LDVQEARHSYRSAVESLDCGEREIGSICLPLQELADHRRDVGPGRILLKSDQVAVDLGERPDRPERVAMGLGQRLESDMLAF